MVTFARERTPLITDFRVRNFKSVEDATLSFRKLNFIVGRNGTGKTNLLDAISFISEAASRPLQVLFNSRGGIESVFRKIPAVQDARSPERSTPDRPRLQIAISLDLTTSQHYERAVKAFYALELETGFVARLPLERTVRVRREQIVVDLPEGERSWFDRHDQRMRSNDKFFTEIPDDIVDKDSLALPLIGGFPRFSPLRVALRSIQSYAIDPGTLREFQEPDAGERLLSDGSNAVAILDQLKKSDRSSLERIFELLGAIAPGTLNVTSMSAGRKRFLRFSQQWGKDKRFRFDAFNMSDGTLRAFGLLLASYQKDAPNVMLVEQPEDSLHPGATAVIIEAFRARPANTQTVITTHSPEVLDNFNPEDDAIYIVEHGDGVTRVNAIAAHLLQGVVQHLCTGGDLLRLRLIDQAPLPFDYKQGDSFFEEL